MKYTHPTYRDLYESCKELNSQSPDGFYRHPKGGGRAAQIYSLCSQVNVGTMDDNQIFHPKAAILFGRIDEGEVGICKVGENECADYDHIDYISASTPLWDVHEYIPNFAKGIMLDMVPVDSPASAHGHVLASLVGQL